LTSLLFIYSTDNESNKKLLGSTIPGLSISFDDLLLEEKDAGLIKKKILNDYFFAPGSKLTPGVYESIDKIFIHLLGFCAVQIQDDINEQYFQLNYNIHRKCINQECLKKDEEKIISAMKDYILFFDAMQCTDSISSKVNEVIHSRVRHYRCEECEARLDELYVVTSTPHILTVHLTSLNFSHPIDEEIEVGGQKYELKSVIYFGGAHFICRFNHEKSVYEYDGYARKGLIHKINVVNPFKFNIKDTNNYERRAMTILYRKEQNSSI
jgi:hypothetical protein